MGNQACDQPAVIAGICSIITGFPDNQQYPSAVLYACRGKGNMGTRLGGLQAVLPDPRRQRRMWGRADVVESIMQLVVDPPAPPPPSSAGIMAHRCKGGPGGG